MSAEEMMARLLKADNLISRIDRIATESNALDYDLLQIELLLDEYYGRDD